MHRELLFVAIYGRYCPWDPLVPDEGGLSERTECTEIMMSVLLSSSSSFFLLLIILIFHPVRETGGD